tara:strand:+ start:3474 stop:3617 length:144 start_codon:yes stop_codon:yes gene_type:complete
VAKPDCAQGLFNAQDYRPTEFDHGNFFGKDKITFNNLFCKTVFLSRF